MPADGAPDAGRNPTTGMYGASPAMPARPPYFSIGRRTPLPHSVQEPS